MSNGDIDFFGTDLVTQMTKRLREILYIERDKRALDEIEWYELKSEAAMELSRESTTIFI